MNFLEEARGIIEAATQCGDHPCEAPHESEWKNVVHYWSSDTCEYGETDPFVVVALVNGQYFVAQESGDTTGHG